MKQEDYDRLKAAMRATYDAMSHMVDAGARLTKAATYMQPISTEKTERIQKLWDSITPVAELTNALAAAIMSILMDPAMEREKLEQTTIRLACERLRALIAPSEVAYKAALRAAKIMPMQMQAERVQRLGESISLNGEAARMIADQLERMIEERVEQIRGRSKRFIR
ncbi:MAG: hypothetical protein LBI57_07035 [Helicobacteraceae bacterium]|nr:hypothetical protein [Helicobacteraceae bacterium]